MAGSVKNFSQIGLQTPFRMVCRDFILSEICKPCLFLSSFQFAKLILPYPMAENFFSILKTERIYRHKPASFCEANERIDRYINFYNYERIQLKTGTVPLTLCHSAQNFIFPYIETFLCCPHNLGRFRRWWRLFTISIGCTVMRYTF